MLFNSLVFWAFFGIFFPVYFWLKGKARLWFTLGGSYLFYGWWDWRFLGLICFLTGVNFWLGLRMDRSICPMERKRWVVISIVTSLVTLGFFKYANFMIDSASVLLRAFGLPAGHGTLEILLPIGISFYTFQAMSYTIDLYRHEIQVERSLLRFATFKAFFPQLVAGPIVRAADFLPQLQKDQLFNWRKFLEGWCLVAWGMVMKVVVADSLALVVDSRFFAPQAMTALSLIIGVVYYAFQIYGDFAGYSLMAIGFARMLGFDFNQNFDRPYFSTSFSEFWRRWHISLSSWLRDYLYIPLGGNRKGIIRTNANLLTTMLLGGLWHGAAWNFVIWGGLHGLYLCIQRWLNLGNQIQSNYTIGGRGKSIARLTSSLLLFGSGVWAAIEFGKTTPGSVSVALVAIAGLSFGVLMLGEILSSSNLFRFAGLGLRGITIFCLVCLAWIYFRVPKWEDAWVIISRILAMENVSFSAVEQRFHVVKGGFLIGLLVAAEALSFRVDVWRVAHRYPFLIGVFLIVCLLLIGLFGTFSGNAFIYFQF